MLEIIVSSRYKSVERSLEKVITPNMNQYVIVTIWDQRYFGRQVIDVYTRNQSPGTLGDIVEALDLLFAVAISMVNLGNEAQPALERKHVVP